MHAVPPCHLRQRGARNFNFSDDRLFLLPAPASARTGNNIKTRGSPISRHTAGLSPGRDLPELRGSIATFCTRRPPPDAYATDEPARGAAVKNGRSTSGRPKGLFLRAVSTAV
jgi:hypothetical protein